jgi:hypothetical protein
MRRNQAAAFSDPDASERRRWTRKNTPLRAVIANADGKNARDCAIVDISAGGAQISTSEKLPIGLQVYLLDTGNGVAYLAKILWSNPTRSGLWFLGKQPIGGGMAPCLSFLRRLLLEAKLREVDRNLAEGVAKTLALAGAGLTPVLVHEMAEHTNGDRKFASALLRAMSLFRK